MFLISPIQDLLKKLSSNTGFELNAYPILVLGVLFLVMGYLFMPQAVALALSLALFLAPLWLPGLLIGGAWSVWIVLRQSEYIASQKTILLEIKPPRSLVKTPLAMETFLQGIHHGPGEGNWYNRAIKGQVRPWWSLEIASHEGRVHFYIWTRAGFRRLIESQLYAQYAGAQVVEVPDYTRLISADPDESWAVWGCDFVHTKQDALPIKTYIEYGLDKVQKEPEQIDPLANLIEFMGSLGKGEHLWLQLPIRVHKGEKYGKTFLVKGKKKPYTWQNQAKELVEEIRTETQKEWVDSQGNKQPGFPSPTKGQSEKMAAIERNVSKLAFDVGARGIYLVSKEGKFDSVVISGLTGIFKQFSSAEWNGFAPSGWMTAFEDYPWEIGVDKAKNEVRRKLVESYRRRQYFHQPYYYGAGLKNSMVMSTEELATIFHIPSAGVQSPSLERIQSATSEAPGNLPV